MKKLALASALIALVMFYVGCKKRNVVEYDLTYSTDFTFSALTVTPGVNYFWTPVVTDISNSLDNNKLNGNIVGDIRCTGFNMKLKGPAGANISIMKDYEFFMTAGTQKEVRVAHCKPWVDGVVTTQTVINSAPSTSTATPVRMKIDSTNLKNYFLEPLINVKLKVYPTNTLSATYTVNATYTVHVKGID